MANYKQITTGLPLPPACGWALISNAWTKYYALCRPTRVHSISGAPRGAFPHRLPPRTSCGWIKTPPRAVPKDAWFVRADAAHLPFRDSTFEAIVSNHSLEHFTDLNGALAELRRVLCESGALFVAVPDASTFTDKLYRWLARGGGHVNAFVSERDTIAKISQATGLPHRATRVLCSSLSFLNRRNSPRPIPRRLILLGAGYEWSLRLYVRLSRRLDRCLGTRLSVYGWAFYFGNVPANISTEPAKNVCIRCGSGTPCSEVAHHIRQNAFHVSSYLCPRCGARNPFMSSLT